MSLKDDFADEMVHSVFIQPWVSNGGMGPIYGEGQTHDCYAEETVTNIRTSKGTESTSTLQIYLDSSVSVSEKDKITYNGKPVVILKVEHDEDSVIVYT